MNKKIIQFALLSTLATGSLVCSEKPRVAPVRTEERSLAVSWNNKRQVTFKMVANGLPTMMENTKLNPKHREKLAKKLGREVSGECAKAALLVLEKIEELYLPSLQAKQEQLKKLAPETRPSLTDGVPVGSFMLTKKWPVDNPNASFFSFNGRPQEPDRKMKGALCQLFACINNNPQKN